MHHRSLLLTPRNVLWLAATATVIGGCHPRANHPGAETPLASAHAVHSARLRAAMQNLDNSVFERLPPELQDETETRRRLRRVAAVADRMADSAAHLPDVLGEATLTPEERAAFAELSGQLRADCENLGILARRQDAARISAAWERIAATCNACHRLFRESPTPLIADRTVE